MLVHQSFRFELDPSDMVRSALASHAGAARFAYNWGLATVVEEAEVADELVRDMVEVLTSFCARLYGRRSARRRAEAALVAAQSQVAA